MTPLAKAGRIARAVASTLEPAEVFARIEQEVRSVVSFERCAIARRDPDTGAHQYWHVMSEIEVRHLARDQGSPWEGAVVYRTGQPHYVPDLTAEPTGSRSRLVEAGLRSTLVLPIRVGTEVYAHLSLSSLRVDAFSARDIEILAAITDHIGPAIRNANLYDEARRSRHFFRSIMEDSADAIVVTTVDWRVSHWNAAAERLFGHLAEDMIGRDIGTVVGDASRGIWNRLTRPRPDGPMLTELHCRRRDGEAVLVHASISPVRGVDGPAEAWCVILKDLTGREIARREREHLIEELEARNAELERFTYTVSHDLKSPLVTITGFLPYVRRSAERADLAALDTDLGHIENATRRMSTMLDDLLELSRVGRQVGTPEWFGLSEIAAEVLDVLAGPIVEHDVDVSVAPELPRVHADRDRLVQVLQNLVDNAVKFSAGVPRPKVEIGTGEVNGEATCFVRDNGPGIEPQLRERVFGLFNRLDPSVQGSGIGLALVRQIVELHGGRVWLEDGENGTGTTVVFTLPSMYHAGSDPEPSSAHGR